MTAPSRKRLALCVPAFNAAGHLPRLLESVRAQTGPFDEILIYDDASTDETADIARAFGAHVIRSDQNTGASVGKNQMAERASAEWIHFHDADDALGPGFVASARGLMDTDADVILFDTEDRDDVTHETLGTRRWDDDELRADPTRYCVLNTVTNCGVYRRDAFLRAGGFDIDETTRYNEDQAMHLRLALSGLRFRASGYPGVIIYRRSGSMSSGHPIECARAQVEVLSRAADATGTRYSSEIGRRLWQLAGVLAGYNDWNHVRRCLSLASTLGYADPSTEHPAMRIMARFSSYGAIRLREAFIRAVKPELRRDLPTVR